MVGEITKPLFFFLKWVFIGPGLCKKNFVRAIYYQKFATREIGNAPALVVTLYSEPSTGDSWQSPSGDTSDLSDEVTGCGFYLGFVFIVDRKIVAESMLLNKFLLPWFRLDDVCCNIGEDLMRTRVVVFVEI
jgi:hypothetical protein